MQIGTTLESMSVFVMSSLFLLGEPCQGG